MLRLIESELLSNLYDIDSKIVFMKITQIHSQHPDTEST